MKHDWQTIKTEYITSPAILSKAALAGKYGVARSYLSARATQEGWDTERNRFLVRLAEQRQEKKMAAIAAQGALFDSACLSLAQDVLERLQKSLLKQDLDARALKDLMVTARYAQEVGKASLGDAHSSDYTAVLTGKLQTYVADSEERSVQETLAAIEAMTPEEWERSIEEALRPYAEELRNRSPEGTTGSNGDVLQVRRSPVPLPRSQHFTRHKG